MTTPTLAPRWTFAALAAAISGNLAAARRREQLDTGSAVELLTAARELLHQAERLADAASQALDFLPCAPAGHPKGVYDITRDRLVLAISQPGPAPADESAPDLTRDLVESLEALIAAARLIERDWGHKLTVAANTLRETADEAAHLVDTVNLEAGR